MLIRYAVILCALTLLYGCRNAPSKDTGRDASQVVQVEVVKAEEHLGHSIDESEGHSVWCDGCRARLLPSGEPFVIYWINNAIKETTFRFKSSQKYSITFTGEIETGVMAYQGKCIDVRQIVKLQEE